MTLERKTNSERNTPQHDQVQEHNAPQLQHGHDQGNKTQQYTQV